jgi:ATP-dependent Clp protease ATP-binding subunit ClpA
MFEKFATPARRAVVAALEEAHRSGASRIGCEHLLIGLAHEQSGLAADALNDAGLSTGRLRELVADQPRRDTLDAEALASVGIDLDEVRQAADQAFGPGALDHPGRVRACGGTRARMTSDARKAMELALRATQASHSRSITSGHILIGIIDQGANGAIRMLAEAQLRPTDLRADVVRRLAEAAKPG